MRKYLVGWRTAGALPGFVRRVLPAVALLLAAATAARAQTTTGNVRGYVTGEAGARVGDVTVLARNLDNNQQRGTVTNESGFYYLGGLRPGRYELTARRIGLTPQTRTVTVAIGQTLDINFNLASAAVTLQAVTVTATDEQAERTRSSEVATNVSRAQIENLPNFERNFLDIARLAPGVTATAVNSSDKKIAAGGQPAEAVNIFIDGATYKSDVLTGGVVGQDASKGNPFPQDAVQEFRIVTQNYKAEYQKAGSAIITATTRSGTNDFELSAFGFNTQPTFVNPNAIDRASGFRPPYKRWQAGASVGGPLKRDELFYFATYELNQRTEPASVRFGSQLEVAQTSNPTLVNALQPYTGGYSQEFLEHLFFGKLTWNQSGRSTIDGSFSLRTDKDFRGFGGTTSYEARENMDIDVVTGVGNWRYAGDRWLNEAQINYQTFSWTPTWINGDLIGRNYEGLLRTGGKDSQQDFDQRRISLRNDLTRSAVQFFGDHVIKMGANVDFLSYRAEKAFTANPVFAFREAENWTRPFRANFGFGDPDVETDNTQFGFYIQDDWSIGQRLILNLGLRWDAETNMINNDYVTPQPLADSLRGPLNDRLFVRQIIPDPNNPAGTLTREVRTIDMLGGLDRYISTGDNRPMYKKAFQPRVGASYDLFGTGNTVLFGGYGLYYDRNYWNSLLDEQFRRQYGVYEVHFRGTQAQCAAEDPAIRASCTVWDDRYFDPTQLRTLTGTVGAPEVFMVANDLTPPSTHQYSGGVRQTWGPTLWTLSYNGVRGRNYMNFIRAAYDLPAANGGTNYRAVFITDDRVKTWYDAVQLQIEKPLRADARWGGGIAYTLSKSEEQGQASDLFWGFDERYPTVADRPRRRAPGDQRHKVVANVIYRLPADVMVSGILNLGSGITVNARDERSGTGTFQVRNYTFTPEGRDFLGIASPFATQQLDLRVEKPFDVGRGQDLSLVIDMFNAFNNANYGCFETTLRSGPNPGYGRPTCAGLGWRLQLGARYSYRGNSSADDR